MSPFAKLGRDLLLGEEVWIVFSELSDITFPTGTNWFLYGLIELNTGYQNIYKLSFFEPKMKEKRPLG